MVLFRTFLLIVFTAFLANGIQSIAYTTDAAIKMSVTFIICISGILFVAVVAFQGIFFNLVIPNQEIPWAEISAVPFYLESLYKVLLVFIVAFNDQYTWSLYPGIALLVAILLYRVYSKISNSYSFNGLVKHVSLAKDFCVLHFLLFALISGAFDGTNFFYFSIILFPWTTACASYTIIKFKEKKQINGFDNKSQSESSKLIRHYFILDKYIGGQFNPLFSQIEFNHLMQCQHYFTKHEQKMQKKYQQSIRELEHLLDDNHQTGFEDETLNQKVEEFKTMEFKPPTQNNTVSNLSINTIGYINDKEGETHFSSNDVNAQTNNTYKTISKFQPKKSKMKQTNQSLTTQNIFKSPINDHTHNNRQTKNKVNYQQTKKLRKLIKHLFRYHLQVETHKDFRIALMCTYYNITVLKNYAHAHYMLLSQSSNTKKDSIVQRNVKLINKMCLENITNHHQYNSENNQNLDLQNLMDLNQQISKFNVQIDNLAQDIMAFWGSILQEKQAQKSFSQGLLCSENQKKVFNSYEELEKLQNGMQKDGRVYLKMSAFYRYVVFKQQQAHEEYLKFKEYAMTRKVYTSMVNQNQILEKGIFLAKISLKKHMPIKFINTAGEKLLQYEKNQAIGMKINQIMPFVVEANHQKFIDYFMLSGKNKMINQKRVLFVKQKSGYVIQVQTYVFVNNLDRTQMIFMFEPDATKEYFQESFENDDDTVQQNVGLILADNEMQIHEITQECQHILNLSKHMLDFMKQTAQRKPYLEDIFESVDYQLNVDIPNLQNKEMKVKSKLGEVLMQYGQLASKDLSMAGGDYEEQKSQVIMIQNNSLKGSHKKESKYQSYSSYNNMQTIDQKRFKLQMHCESFMNKKIQMRIIAVKQINSDTVQQSINNIETFAQIPNKNELIKSKEVILKKEDNGGKQIDNGTESFNQEGFSQGELSMSSQSSSRSNNSSVMSRYSYFTNSLVDTNFPKTLKIFLQVSSLALVIVICTGIVCMVINVKMINSGNNDIDFFIQSAELLCYFSNVRLIFRTLLNIGNNLQYDYSEIMVNRTLYYTALANSTLELLRLKYIRLKAIQDALIGNVNTNVTIELLEESLSLTSQDIQVNQAIDWYVNYGNDLLINIQNQGASVLQSSLAFISPLMITKQLKGSILEREMYYLVYNGNTVIYDSIKTTIESYRVLLNDDIQNKINYQSYISWTSISICVVCCTTLYFLLWRIQNRAITLMQIFYSVEKKDQEGIIDSISKYVRGYQGENQVVETTNVKKDQDIKVKIEEYQDDQNIDDKQEINNIARSGATKVKKHKKKDKFSADNDQPENAQVQQANQEEAKQIISQRHGIVMGAFKFDRQKKKIAQLFIMLFVCALVSAYFVANYLMANQVFQDIFNSLEVVQIAIQRTSCAQNSMYSIIETYTQNKSVYSTLNSDDIITMFLEDCLLNEQNFSDRILKAQPTFFDYAQPFIQEMETGEFCTTAYQNQTNTTYGIVPITVDYCEAVDNNITQKGVSNLFHLIYNQVTQWQINLKHANDTHNITYAFIQNTLRDSDISLFVDILEEVIEKPQEVVWQAIDDSTNYYMNTQLTSYYLIFFAFILVIGLVMLFGYRVFKFFRRDMVLQNRMLYFIDFEKIKDDDQKIIAKFLVQF